MKMYLPEDPRQPLVTIVILNYNASKYLETCISTVMKTKGNYEVIVVDNASTDNSQKILGELRNKFPQMRIVFLSSNIGFSLGNNYGARYAKGKYIMFLNPDTFVVPDWLESLVDVLGKDKSIGAAQPKLLLYDKRIDSAGGYMNTFGVAWCRGNEERDCNRYNHIDNIFFAKGAAILIRRDLFESIGKFDPLFLNYWEEVDLCWKVWMRKYRVVYVPESIVYHEGAAILRKYKHATKYNQAKGRMVILIKNHSMRNVVWVVPVAMILIIPEILKYLLIGHDNESEAIVKGSLWWIFNVREIWKARLYQKAVGLSFMSRLPVAEKFPFGYLSSILSLKVF